ncbi:MAG: membrane-associated protein [Firmicutes bacterium]|nr:membrane-associated protein [Bacillota bacterium]
MQKIDVRAFSIALGTVCAIGMLFIGLASTLGWGMIIVDTISSFYIGFAPTFWGSIIGAIWGFIDGALGGAIFALIYNKLAK